MAENSSTLGIATTAVLSPLKKIKLSKKDPHHTCIQLTGLQRAHRLGQFFACECPISKVHGVNPTKWKIDVIEETPLSNTLTH